MKADCRLGANEMIQLDVKSPNPPSMDQTKGEVSIAATELISELLVKEGVITEDQLRHAKRVQSKLPGQRTLIGVLQDLRYVTAEQVRNALRVRRLSLPLGSLLIELGYLREQELRTALRVQAEDPGKKLGQILLESHLLQEDKLIEVLSIQLGFERLNPMELQPMPDFLHVVSLEWFRQNNCIPLAKQNGKILVAFADPLDMQQVEGARKMLGSDIVAGIARVDEIQRALSRIADSKNRAREMHHNENVIVQAVNDLITEAADANVSDIHLEPTKNLMRVRFRVDGVLVKQKEFPLEMVLSLTSRIKIMANADIAEKRRHQDGRILFEYRGNSLDIRVSTYGTIYGEAIVMRLLNNRSQLMDIREIGMSPRIADRYIEDVLDSPSGVVIITGPTGSGKTTTLYASIHYLNKPDTAIITAEDPVEYLIDGISQCSINPKINVTFEDTLKHMVRQDPDVMVIGEIRDRFSAEAAISAALTGHKVLTTFHTEDSIGGLMRLMNMNIEAFLISSTVISVVAQRLLRRLCPHCSEPQALTSQQARRLGYAAREALDITFKVGRGCPHCKFRGYSGRVAIFELLVLNESVKDAILAHKTSYEIRRISAETTGLVTLLEDAICKAANGLTSFDEIIRQVPRLNKPRLLAELYSRLGESR
jgi:type IV pilus assembly protein PilB